MVVSGVERSLKQERQSLLERDDGFDAIRQHLQVALRRQQKRTHRPRGQTRRRPRMQLEKRGNVGVDNEQASFETVLRIG